MTSNVHTDLRPIDVCSGDEIEIVSEDVEGDMRDDFTNFAWGESGIKFRNINDEDGNPCSSSTTGASFGPASR